MQKKFISVLFKCCNVYNRIYINKEENGLPWQMSQVPQVRKVQIGEGGTDTRFFEVY